MTPPAISAAIEPTDRSMPPLMITKHMPTAMMPMNDVRVSTFIALSTVAKSWFSAKTATHSASRPTTGPSPCRRVHAWRARVTPRSRVLAGAGASVESGGVGNQGLFGELVRRQRGLQRAGAHHGDAVADADQLDQIRRDR